jgi:predicted ATPase/DNA-binding NarL/FixJ family response regulator
MPGSVAARSESAAIAAVPDRGWGVPVPAPLTQLIGRRRELAEACAMLRRGATRLLTLTGPGGIGKTRLALEVAAELEDDFDDGVVWVPLAPVADPDAVVAAIAASVGISGAGVEDRLVRVLRGRRLLLILDNFEHVAEAAPRVADLLAACPHLQAVATSRSRLRIRGERTLPVPPLSLSHESVGGSTATGHSPLSMPLTLHAEAVTLFIERAQAVAPNIEFGEANSAFVAEICRRLDGLPLAIELAAARVGHLTLPSLLERMDQRLPLLVGGDRDLPARLQTMRDAIAWSHDLLSPQEQDLLRCFAVFDGGCTLEAIEHLSPSTTLDLIASLVDKNLVRHEPASPGGPRYAMLETVRELAAERLAEAGEATAARQAHAAYYLALAEREAMADCLPDGEQRLDALEEERANTRAALSWWMESGQPEQCLAHAAAFGRFWYVRNHLREGQEWLERALNGSDGQPSFARARALVWLGAISFLRGDMQGAARRSAEGLALCRALGSDARPEGSGGPVSGAAPFSRSQRALTESHALHALGTATFHLGDPDGASSWFAEGRDVAESIPDPRLATLLAVLHTRSLGILAGEQGDLDQAGRLFDAALQRVRSIEHAPGVRRGLGDLAYVSLRRGDYADALARYQEALAQAHSGFASVAVYDDLLGAAIAAALLHRDERAVRCLAASEALSDRLGLAAVMPSEREAWDRAVAAVRRGVGDETFASAWASGRALRPEQAIAEILAIARIPSKDEKKVILSERELDVLRLLVAGHTDRAIGETLFISHRTVEFHVSRILAKLGVRNHGGAIAAALVAGLVEPPAASQRTS